MPATVATPSQIAASRRRAAALSARQHQRSHGKTFRDLVQHNRQENDPAQPAGNQKARGNRHAVKKRVNGQAQQRGNSGVVRHKMLHVRFFSEMKMRRERMFKKMNDEISDQHQEIRGASGQGHRLGKNFEDGRGQHETRAQRQKIFQVLARPFAVQDK